MSLDKIAPFLLAAAALVTLAASHWLQMPDQAMTAMVGVLGGAVTLFYVNKPSAVTPHDHVPDLVIHQTPPQMPQA